MGEVNRPQPQATEVMTPCGCTYVATHTVGERLFRCDHQQWLIRAVAPRKTNYLVETLHAKGTDQGRSDKIKEIFG